MSLTRVDCDFYRGSAPELETSSYVAFNPGQLPGGVVVGASLAAKSSIGSQVACKLCLEHFVEGVLDRFETEMRARLDLLSENLEDPPRPVDLSQGLLESAFKRANSSVYNFGHKLAAGGRMAASLLGLVVEERVVATGRVGNWGVFLLREGELFPFFEEKEKPVTESSLDGFVGSKSLVTIETATVPVEPSDLIFAFSTRLIPEKQKMLVELSKSFDFLKPQACQMFVERLFSGGADLAFAALIRVGPDAIYLSDVLGD